MDLLKEKIRTEGSIIGKDILKVDSFLNHQIDINLYNEIGKEFKKRFQNKSINKILTVEASGIGIACIVAQYFNVPVVFAKKHDAANMDKETYEAQVFSFTKNKNYSIKVSKRYISSQDNILIIDDFLANGNAVTGLISIVTQGGGSVQGVGIVIEKAYQEGRKKIVDLGIQLESLAVVRYIEDNIVHFE
jgi:xanthine phosphoribosyltransferase